jgi:putative ATP-dependent endonuclease of OLD family
LLEKLNLVIDAPGKPGLGSNNLLFMACELLLLAREDEGAKLLLIEEPEAHLHAQRQLRAMRFLQEQAHEKGIQIIVTTHSPNLASVIALNNIVLVQGRRAFSMAEGETELEKTDYRFLQRFLDVTKANLFFARGVMIVEGDAENILLPTLARLLGRDFAEHGVSIINVGGVGLRRYARIFQRKNPAGDGTDQQVGIPVACVTDMDVMPNCAPVITGNVGDDEAWPELACRRWRAKKDVPDLAEDRKSKLEKASGQCVKTFVSDEWTLEYDLALGPKGEDRNFSGGLAEDVYVAACLAEEDEAINAGLKRIDDVANSAVTQFCSFKDKAVPTGDCAAAEVLAAHVYAKFARDGVSKAIAAQYLAERLQDNVKKGNLTAAGLRTRLPKYLTEAIDYVTARQEVIAGPRNVQESTNE